MNEKTRVLGKGFVLGVIGAVATALFEYFKKNGMPATKDQWLSIGYVGVAAALAYVGLTLPGAKKDEEPTDENIPRE